MIFCFWKVTYFYISSIIIWSRCFIDNSAAKQQFPPFFTVLIHRREMRLSLFSWILSSFLLKSSVWVHSNNDEIPMGPQHKRDLKSTKILFHRLAAWVSLLIYSQGGRNCWKMSLLSHFKFIKISGIILF